MKKIISIPLSVASILLFLLLGSCGQDRSKFSHEEAMMLEQSDSVMYVLTVNDTADLRVLRTQSVDLSDSAIHSQTFRLLSSRLLSTVKAPEEGGVGISAPQIGLNRRVIAVQRFDKEGEPFEVYVNVKIDSLIGPVVRGREGCLSVPPMKGIVPRYSSVIVSYKDPVTLEEVRDSVSGYTAVIFQHECDHLDGILFTDKADSVMVDEQWKAERAVFESQGRYKKK